MGAPSTELWELMESDAILLIWVHIWQSSYSNVNFIVTENKQIKMDKTHHLYSFIIFSGSLAVAILAMIMIVGSEKCNC